MLVSERKVSVADRNCAWRIRFFLGRYSSGSHASDLAAHAKKTESTEYSTA